MNSPMPRVSRLLLCAAAIFWLGGAAGAAATENFRDGRIAAVVCAVSPTKCELVLADDGAQFFRTNFEWAVIKNDSKWHANEPSPTRSQIFAARTTSHCAVTVCFGRWTSLCKAG